MIITKPEQIELYRLKVLLSALKLEANGLKLSRGSSALSVVKKQFGFKGSRERVTAQLQAFHDAKLELLKAN